MSNKKEFTPDQVQFLDLNACVVDMGYDNIAARTRFGDVPIEFKMRGDYNKHSSRDNSPLPQCDDACDNL